MTDRRERAHLFGRHDRLVIDGQCYRVDDKVKGVHYLQLINDNLIEDFFVTKTDREINDLISKNRLRIDEGYFSKTLSLLRMKYDSSDLGDLSEDELRTVAWKKEWCVRFLTNSGDRAAAWRPSRNPADMKQFISNEMDNMDQWYLDQFGTRRPPGRRRKGELRKAFDYPSASTLRDWLKLFAKFKYRMDAFRPNYAECGNRNQLDTRALALIEEEVKKFGSVLRPLMGDIYENIEAKFYEFNKNLDGKHHIKVSDKAVRRRIHMMDPFLLDAARYGEDYALRKYTPVGRGMVVTRLLEHTEMDDWEADLHTLIVKSSVWNKLSKEAKAKVPRTRCTLTIGIEKLSRCVVGMHLSPHPPSAATAKSALRSIMIDKSPQAKFAGAKSDWNMHGTPEYLSTDGGAVFLGEYEEALRMSAVSRSLPEKDPRMRGTVESFFRTLKRLCRYFAGRSFANVVEKGDYPAEKMASLTYQEFYKSLIIFIVDYYHHRAHRGLNGGTPYGKWHSEASRGLPPTRSRQQIIVAFGLRDTRKVDKEGITYVNQQYHSEDLGALYPLVGDMLLDIIIDPDDLSMILVRVPKYVKDRKAFENKDYIEAKCQTAFREGVTLVDVLEANKDVMEEVRKQQEAGRPIRLAAHGKLLDIAEDGQRIAGVPAAEITQKDYDSIKRRLERKGKAALTGVNYAEAPVITESGRPGKVVAESARTKPRAPGKTPSELESSGPTDVIVKQLVEDSASLPRPLKFSDSMNVPGEDE
ncbi:Mu transposase C-terminal domain-containing protein [Candidatus Phyllobacterium onerii]|uniref:Mu transposase C-terminal domain-containing protein n=1 Tax=Candidatus Phyllobacterium onerii TaxID=3020828 RepID=UPI00232AFABE|nr:Mu transposase C-terminal domain-containing protein [Phyllobacterium sp. IY22]